MRRRPAIGAVLAFGLVAGGFGACASLPPVPQTTPAPTSSSESASTTTPGPTRAIAEPTAPPPTRTFCGRIGPVDCHASIELVRGIDPARVAAADAIVTDDTCPPRSMCDRLNPFEVLVVLVSGEQMTAGYMVFGHDGPERVALGWPDPLPAHLAAAVATAIGR